VSNSLDTHRLVVLSCLNVQYLAVRSALLKHVWGIKNRHLGGSGALIGARRGDAQMRTSGLFVVLAVALFVAPDAVQGAPGDLDPTFGVGGKVTTLVSPYDWLYALVLQPDGKLVAAGRAEPGGHFYEFALLRYNADGSLDTTFGSGGIVTTPIGCSFAELRALVQQPDGRLVAAGYGNVSAPDGQCLVTNFALARYNADGSLDASFGTNGKVTTGFGDWSDAYALVLQPDGKLVAAGSGWGFGPGFVLARYNADGSLDTTFGNGGKVRTVIQDPSAQEGAYALALQPDGKLVAAGYVEYCPYYCPDHFDWALARYNADGSLDTTFGNGGKVTTSFGGWSNIWQGANALALQADGKIVAAGNIDVNTYSVLALRRYNPDGSLDATFGDAGTARSYWPLLTNASAVVIQPDRRLVAAGSGFVSGWGTEFALARYNTNGSLDGTFGNAGVATTASGRPSEWATALALQPDGRLVAGGTGFDGSNRYFALARFVGNICGNGILEDGEQCDDGNLIDGDGCDSNCTLTACGNGVVTAGEQCDDGNTVGGDCCSSSCQFEASGSPCGSDPNRCTGNICNGAGVCSSRPPTVCPALDQCHDGICNPATGACSSPAKANGATCSDGSVCTTTDTCQNGVCVPGPALSCNDGVNCTVDTCAPTTGCHHTAVNALCDDGNACIADVCDTALGCLHVPLSGSACSDGSLCTVGDTCQNGACTPGTPINCDDQIPCTRDTCDPASGCIHSPIADCCTSNGQCTDGNVCNGVESCNLSTHTCVPGAPPPLACGNGCADTGEQCGEPSLAACPSGQTCQGCTCTGGDCAGVALGCPSAVPPDNVLDIDITINAGARPLGAYSVLLVWNPSLLRLDSVSGGTTTEFNGSPTCSINNTIGTASCAASQAIRLDGPTGMLDVAHLHMTALGTGGSGGALSLTVNSLFDTSGTPIAACAARETCTLGSGGCGDVNGDGLINIGDSLSVAQYDVGLRQCGVAPFSRADLCDVNPDGACNVGDSLKLAQCDVGLISCGFACQPFACPASLMNAKLEGTTRVMSNVAGSSAVRAAEAGFTAPVQIVLPAVSPAPGVSVTADIQVNTGSTPLGAYNVSFDCDSDVLEIVTPVAGGITAEFTGTPSQTVTGCHADLDGLQAVRLGGPTGTVSVGRVTVRVKDSAVAGTTSSLALSVRSLFDTGGLPIAAAPQDATITVGSAPPANHDSVVLPIAPMTVTVPVGRAAVTTTVAVTVRNADVLPAAEKPGHTIQLIATDGDCPAGTISGLPNFQPRTPGIHDSVLVTGGRTKTAKVPLRIARGAFTTVNAKAPHRCTLVFQASTLLPSGSIDPTVQNNAATLELNVIDKNDPGQATLHESAISSVAPMTLQIRRSSTAATGTRRPIVGNADILPTAEQPGHAITVIASDGDCPDGTVGTLDFGRSAFGSQNSALVQGGKTLRGKIAVTATAGGFMSANAKSPARCTAMLTATGPGGETDATNDSTKLVIDVIDRNDF